MHLKRILWHLSFWSLFFFISLFNELYLSSSFSDHPNWDSFLRGTISQVLLYSVKVLVVYYSIYSIIPRWSAYQSRITDNPFRAQGSSLRFLLEFIFVLLAGALLMRVIVQCVIWVYVFPGEERVLSFASLLGRYFYSLFDLIPITLIAVAIKLVQLRVSALKQETILVQEKIRSELQYLKAQTNPHFLFNTLNGIYALSRKQDEHTPAAILNLSNILRYMLYEAGHRTSPIRDELKLITDYIALQQLRFQQHLTISFSRDVEDEEAGISPLLLLPLVENACKHSNDLDTHIDISVSEAKGILHFSVSNTLSAQADHDPLIKDGIGLSNIKRQLAILYRDYSFSASKSDTAFTVDLMIRLNSYNYV